MSVVRKRIAKVSLPIFKYLHIFVTVFQKYKCDGKVFNLKK